MAPGTAGHHTNASWYKFRKIELQTQVHILKQISLGSRTQMQSDTNSESRWTFFNCFPFIDVAGQQPSIKGWNISLRWKFHLELIVLEGIYKHQARKGAAKVSKKKLRTNHLQPEPPIENETPWASPSRPSYLMNAASVHFQIPKKIFPGVFLMDFFFFQNRTMSSLNCNSNIFSPY